MPETPQPSEFRVEKRRVEAAITLSNREVAHGCFFVSGSGPLHEGPERVGQLLNVEDRFFPFERTGTGAPTTVLYSRSQVVVVSLADPEAQRVPGYEVATPRVVSLLMTSGDRIVGSVRVYRPEGRDRVSDWARDPAAFRYVETDQATLLVNVEHIVEVREQEEG